jgi:CRP/FNR family transcriptional regulator, cyclic AMP receptor protein
MDHWAAMAAIGNVPLFSELTDEEIQRVLAVAKEVEFPAGKTIAEQDGPGLGFHMILEGGAEVTVGGDHRSALGPGDYFGEISLIDERPRSATVTTTQPTKTLSIASWDFLPLLDRFPSIARNLLIGLCKTLRQSESASR